ncbi:NUDIX domain-containing protein [Streptomyces sp. NPDC093089]|uniref:NUDIX domain-containing protein n=1 Tax=Streptomyces sp. NPDC093089 TaxID=3366024 RepID=UPI0038040C08
MSGERHTVPVDVHLIAVREGRQGPEVLLSRRAGDVYAAGLWHAPSGHVERETVVTAVVRETREETGLVVDPADVRAAVTVHHRPPGGRERVGFFFEVRRWQGSPRVAEPDKCDAMGWFPLDALPDPMVAYCRAGLDAYRAGAPVALHFQDPDDGIAYSPSPGHDPGLDRLHLVPAAGPAKRRAEPKPRASPERAPGPYLARQGQGQGQGQRQEQVPGLAPTPCSEPVSSPQQEPTPPRAVRAFAERAVGRIAAWTDVSWARENSRVWRAAGTGGGLWFVKIHQNPKFHRRETDALRGWVPDLGDAGPRLVAADPELLAVVVTPVEGRSLHGAVLSAAEEAEVLRSIGVLAARIHASPLPPEPRPSEAPPTDPYDRMERHLAAARPLLEPGDEGEPGDEECVRRAVAAAQELAPLEHVVTHGDFQYRNLLLAADGTVRFIDVERSEPHTRVRDLTRLIDRFDGRPDLAEAFFAGYGRPLTAAEETHLAASTALDAVSGIAFGTRAGDPELVERGRRTLARLRAGARWPFSHLPQVGDHTMRTIASAEDWSTR